MALFVMLVTHRRLATRSFLVAVSLLLTTIYMVVAAPRAWACAGEDTLFRGSFSTQSRGTTTTNWVHDRSLNSSGDCLGSGGSQAEAHSTAHIEPADLTRWAEVGWVEKWEYDNLQAKYVYKFRAFWETGNEAIRRKSCDTCGWPFWSNNRLYFTNTISGWHAQIINSHHYKVVPN